jgi:chemotaxis-related protein WspB
MLLVMCHVDDGRFALDARHVAEVLPRALLQRLSGSPPWLAGILVHRAAALPVVDLAQLSEGKRCPNRLSSRIVVLQTECDGQLCRFGLLAERVGVRELQHEPKPSGEVAAGPAALGSICLDEQGLFQWVDIARLLTAERRAVLFPVEMQV